MTAAKAPAAAWAVLLACLAGPPLSAGEAASPRGAGPGARAPAERRLRLDLWGADFDAVMDAFRRDAGLELVPRRRDLERPVYLVARDVAARDAVEMLARALGARYRRQDNHVRLVDGYEWLTEPGVLRSVPVESLLTPGENPAALEARLRETARVVPLLGTRERWGFAVRAIPSGVGVRLNCRLETCLPRTLADYVERMLMLLAAPGEGIGPVPRRTAPPPAPGGDDHFVAIRLKDEPARSALAELALQTDWTLGFDAEAFAAGPPPPISLEIGHVPAREAATALARALGLGGAERWRDGIVWLERRPRGWERTRPDREVLWEGLATRGFAVGPLVAKAGGWDVLREQVRRAACPWIWDDPMTALAYHPGTGTLAVRAPAPAVEAVRAELARLTLLRQD